MRLLVTGGAGFIGSNFVHYLGEKHPDYDIVVVDAFTYAGNRSSPAPVAERITVVEADIFVADRPGHDRRYAIDASLIGDELGWEPSVSFEEGIAAPTVPLPPRSTSFDAVPGGRSGGCSGSRPGA